MFSQVLLTEIGKSKICTEKLLETSLSVQCGLPKKVVLIEVKFGDTLYYLLVKWNGSQLQEKSFHEELSTIVKRRRNCKTSTFMLRLQLQNLSKQN